MPRDVFKDACTSGVIKRLGFCGRVVKYEAVLRNAVVPSV